MTHNDYERLRKIRYQWQKEQQLIRQKYQIPYSMTYISKQCFDKSISTISKIEALFQHKKGTVTDDNFKIKTFNNKNHKLNTSLIHCLKCRVQCSCSNRLNQRDIKLKMQSYSKGILSNLFLKFFNKNVIKNRLCMKSG